MKKYILLFALIAYVFSTAFAQTPYHKMVVEGAHWRVESTFCDYRTGCNPLSGSNIVHYNTHYYKLEGHTIIDSLAFKKMYSSYYLTCPACPQGQPFIYPICYPYQLSGFLTEDTLSRKVYFKSIDPSSAGLELINNFSLAVGDSIVLGYHCYETNPPADTNNFIIDSIGSTIYGNDTVKTWYLRNVKSAFNGMPDIELYEGIGYFYGFDLGYTFADAIDYTSRLTGFCHDSTCWSSCRITGINDLIPDDTYVSIYPNPSDKAVTIKSLGARILNVELFDLNGRKRLVSSSDQVDISSLSSGLYLAVISTNVGIARKRIVKE